MAGKLRIDENKLSKLFIELESKLKMHGLTKTEIISLPVKIGFGKTQRVTKELLTFLRKDLRGVIYTDGHYYKLTNNVDFTGMISRYIDHLTSKSVQVSSEVNEIDSNSDPKSKEMDKDLKIGDEVYLMMGNQIAKGTIIGICGINPKNINPNDLLYYVYNSGTDQNDEYDRSQIFKTKDDILEYLSNNIINY